MPPAKALMALLAPPAKALMALLASLPSFIAAFCINFGAFCCVLRQLGGVLLRSALILRQIAPPPAPPHSYRQMAGVK